MAIFPNFKIKLLLMLEGKNVLLCCLNTFQTLLMFCYSSAHWTPPNHSSVWALSRLQWWVFCFGCWLPPLVHSDTCLRVCGAHFNPPVCLVSLDQVSRCQNKLNKVSSLVWIVFALSAQRHQITTCVWQCVYINEKFLLSSSSVVSSSGPTTKTNCPSTTRWRFLVGIGRSSRQRSQGKSIKKNGPHTGATGPPNSLCSTHWLNTTTSGTGPLFASKRASLDCPVPASDSPFTARISVSVSESTLKASISDGTGVATTVDADRHTGCCRRHCPSQKTTFALTTARLMTVWATARSIFIRRMFGDYFSTGWCWENIYL